MPKNQKRLNVNEYLFGNQSKTEINDKNNIKIKLKFNNTEVCYNDLAL